MPVNFNTFTEATTTTIQSNDYVVGFDNTSPNGERKYLVSTLANAVSGIIAPSIQTFTAPTGTVAYYAASTAPIGWDECDGTALTVALGSSYTALRNFLIAGGSIFGNDGSGNPKVPDLRGKFIRSHGADGTYFSSTFGTLQADAFEDHTHSYSVPGQTFSSQHVATGNFNAPHPASSAGNTGGASIGSDTETRPANIALLACIKL
jgi:microcystin-dependent protein